MRCQFTVLESPGLASPTRSFAPFQVVPLNTFRPAKESPASRIRRRQRSTRTRRRTLRDLRLRPLERDERKRPEVAVSIAFTPARRGAVTVPNEEKRPSRSRGEMLDVRPEMCRRFETTSIAGRRGVDREEKFIVDQRHARSGTGPTLGDNHCCSFSTSRRPPHLHSVATISPQVLYNSHQYYYREEPTMLRHSALP